MCLHSALGFISFYLVNNMTIFRKKECFDLSNSSQGSRVCIRTEYVLAWFPMLHSNLFHMHHDFFQKECFEL